MAALGLEDAILNVRTHAPELAPRLARLSRAVSELAYRIQRGDSVASTRGLYRRIRHRRLDIIQRIRRTSDNPFTQEEIMAFEAAFTSLTQQFQR